jgi:hypothetical protein
MKLLALNTKRSGRVFSKKIFAFHMYTLFLQLLMFGIVVAPTKAAVVGEVV